MRLTGMPLYGLTPLDNSAVHNVFDNFCVTRRGGSSDGAGTSPFPRRRGTSWECGSRTVFD